MRVPTFASKNVLGRRNDNRIASYGMAGAITLAMVNAMSIAARRMQGYVRLLKQLNDPALPRVIREAPFPEAPYTEVSIDAIDASASCGIGEDEILDAIDSERMGAPAEAPPRVAELLEHCTARQRAAIEEHVLGGKSLRTVAALLDIDHKAVCGLVRRGLRSIQIKAQPA